MKVVSDSSPLIWLSKIGNLRILRELYGDVIIPWEVYEEVVAKGLREGFSDALVVKRSIKEGWIRIEELDPGDEELAQTLKENAVELHRGEAHATLLARRRRALLLMDESSGRALAETWGIDVKGSLYVVLQALREGLLTREEAKEAVTSMIIKGFRIDPGLVTRVLNTIENF